jgi:hypothetical protein
MTAAITMTEDTLVVQIGGADRLWALRSRLEVPITNVVGVAPATSQAHEWLHGIRVGGTHIPGVISAGRFYSQGTWVFWDVHDPDKAIGIDLRDERYDKLVIEVDDPQARSTGSERPSPPPRSAPDQRDPRWRPQPLAARVTLPGRGAYSAHPGATTSMTSSHGRRGDRGMAGALSFTPSRTVS